MVELGAGLGLPGLFLARRGAKVWGVHEQPSLQRIRGRRAHSALGAAQVTLTDRASVLPLLRENAERNTRDMQGSAWCARMTPAMAPVPPQTKLPPPSAPLTRAPSPRGQGPWVRAGRGAGLARPAAEHAAQPGRAPAGVCGRGRLPVCGPGGQASAFRPGFQLWGISVLSPGFI